MKALVSAYVVTALCMLTLDSLWLGATVDSFYRPLIGELLAENFRIAPAVGFYILYIAGIVILAVRPGLMSDDWRTAAGHGLVLGLVAYGTYDLTNQATLKVWPTMITAVDLCWGAFLTSSAAVAGYFGGAYFRSR